MEKATDKKYVIIEDSENNFIDATRVVGVIAFNSSPARKLKKGASSSGRLIDATQGKRTKSLIFTDSGHVWQTNFDRDIMLDRLKNALI
ncbi:MAG: DUF370 domain-containing protein [Candidatus Coatesbacteria bacterium]|nr:DUF370 domain-containing protein [Candidatus Coatesbacteria bacterium]